MDDAGERVASDRALVAAITAGDPAGLEGAYRRYADRLHAYSRSLVGDREAAADVVHDTFLIAAERIGQLREPDRLGAWLYAIARSECLQRLRQRRRTVTWADPPELAADATDPGRAVQTAQIRALVRAATAGLNSGDREVIELAVRHDLSPAAISTVLGVSANHAHARVSRAREQLEGALGALLVARSGAGRCEALDALLLGWDGTLTPLLRKRINRHVRECQPCANRRADWLTPSALLSAYAALPFVVVGLAPRSPQWISGGPAVGRSPVQAPASPVPVPASRDPGPASRDPGPASPIGPPPGGRTRRTVTIAVGVLVILLFAGAGAAIGLGSRGRLGAQSEGPPPTVAVSAGGGGGPLIAPPTGSPTDGTGPTSPPGASVTTGPPATSTPTQGLVLIVPFTAAAAARRTCDGGNFSLFVGVETSGGTLASATLYWRNSVITRTRPMELDGPDARRTVTVFAQQVTWWVTARASDGRSVTTPQRVAANPCP